ncbi:MAG: hypothetical protein HFJ25_01695 [Clostridia bacterium]|jgi:hypothetical protein|nr:hypothetical protein [Clostridia bacterium]
MKEVIAIIEIGSNNTKTHVYEREKSVYENTETIEFKKNYKINKKISGDDLEKLCTQIKKAFSYTKNVYVFGCSIFRSISEDELNEINDYLYNKFDLKISVVSQEEEASLTAFGCYSDIGFDGNVCVFIGGGGSTELLIINNKEIVDKKYFDFGVVDITSKFSSLKEDIPVCTFDEVYSYIDSLVGDFNVKCDLLILAGGDHLYWYNNARYDLLKNTLYENDKQEFMITIDMSDKYDRDAYVSSLNRVRENSDNPLWFDGSRAMKAITNVISHKIDAKYIVPTRINMEDGLKKRIVG